MSAPEKGAKGGSIDSAPICHWELVSAFVVLWGGEKGFNWAVLGAGKGGRVFNERGGKQRWGIAKSGGL